MKDKSQTIDENTKIPLVALFGLVPVVVIVVFFLARIESLASQADKKSEEALRSVEAITERFESKLDGISRQMHVIDSRTSRIEGKINRDRN